MLEVCGVLLKLRTLKIAIKKQVYAATIQVSSAPHCVRSTTKLLTTFEAIQPIQYLNSLQIQVSSAPHFVS